MEIILLETFQAKALSRDIIARTICKEGAVTLLTVIK